MIYAVIVQRLTRGCMIARVPEKVLSPGASSHQGRLAVGRVLGEDGFGTAHWGLSPRPEGSAGYRQLPIVAQRGCLNGTVYIMLEDGSALEIRLRKTGTFSAREARQPRRATFGMVWLDVLRARGAASSPEPVFGPSGFDLIATAQER